MPADAPVYDPAAEMAAFIASASKDGTPAEPKEPKPEKAAPFKAAKPAEPEADESEDEQGEAKEAKNPVQDRINKAVGRQRAAERATEAATAQVKALEARLEALEKGLTPAKAESKVVDEAPDPAKFTYGELDPKYIAALARYETKLAYAEAQAENTKAQQAEKQTAAQTEAQKHVNERLADISAKGAAKYGDDFQETVIEGIQRNEWPLSQTLAELLLESDFGHDIAYELASDLELAKKVYGMIPGKQAAWFGRQEAKDEDEAPEPEGEERKAPAVSLAKVPATRTLSKAPPPLSYRTKGAVAATPAGNPTNDFAEFERRMMARK